ncbi:MAG: DMT family transporter [Alphaproteobacteria bacterium]|jgi:drug/metabolite transporter (DMT)-like permease|nr:DMT family transporter [Alphaproteobacteria bacterium]
MKLQHLKTLLILCSPPVIWGILFIMAVPIFKEIDPLFFPVVRYVPSVIVLLIVLLIIEGKKAFKVDKKFLQAMLLGAISMAGFNILVWIGVALSGGVIASVMQPVAPLMAVIFSFILFKEKFSLPTFVVIFIAFCGVFIAASEGDFSFLFHGHPLGFLLIFFGVSLSVLSGIYAPRFKEYSFLRYASITSLGGCVAFVISSIVSINLGYTHVPSLDNILNISGYLLYAVVLAGSLPMLLVFKGVKLVGPVNTMLLMNLVPVVAIVGSMVAGYKITTWEICGALIVIFAMTLHYFNVKRNNQNF